MNQRELFFLHLAQTSPAPLALDIVQAEGCRLTDAAGKRYLDLIGGISVANTGHRHPDVIAAIHQQLDQYLHVMVYGEFIQSPQVRYAARLTSTLPNSLNAVYFTNSGAEAVEGAMKLAKRATRRTQIIAFNHSYHGSTQGALSIIGDEYWRNAFRPLLPGISHYDFNDDAVLNAINENVACVILETVQAEAGIVAPRREWIESLRDKCRETGTLFILDEIQTGFGRTGKLWGFENFNIVPDILLLGKALGGGMPLGAFIADKNIMDQLSDQPVLGHITTFGGHPVCCAAGLASFEWLLANPIFREAESKSELLKQKIQHAGIKAIRSYGLWMAIDLGDPKTCKSVVDECISNGLITDWFLFAANCLRVSPPLTITESELEEAAKIILTSIQNVIKQ